MLQAFATQCRLLRVSQITHICAEHVTLEVRQVQKVCVWKCSSLILTDKTMEEWTVHTPDQHHIGVVMAPLAR